MLKRLLFKLFELGIPYSLTERDRSDLEEPMNFDLSGVDCISCGKWHEWERTLMCNDCAQRSNKMSDERHLAALERILEQIKGGLKLFFYDDTTIGDKSTHCSWGLCSENKEQWPDVEDHLWPYQFEKEGRVAPLYRENHQHCPFDAIQNDDFRSGCFYSCMIFQHNLRERGQAIIRYQQIINLFKSRRTNEKT